MVTSQIGPQVAAQEVVINLYLFSFTLFTHSS